MSKLTGGSTGNLPGVKKDQLGVNIKFFYMCNFQVQPLFQRLKTIATLVNYKCKSFV